MAKGFLKKYSFYIQKSNREILIGFCALLAIAIRFIFPASLAGEWFWLNLLLFLVFPTVVVKYILKEDLKNFGFTPGNAKTGIILAVPAILLFIAVNYLFITKTNFQSSFQIYVPIATSFVAFLWFELVISSLAFLSREFFFRGFLQLGLEKRLGYYILPVQSALYALLFVKTSWLTIGTAFFSALMAGLIARFSRSIYYSFAFLWIVSITTDIILIKAILSSIK